MPKVDLFYDNITQETTGSNIHTYPRRILWMKPLVPQRKHLVPGIYILSLDKDLCPFRTQQAPIQACEMQTERHRGPSLLQSSSRQPTIHTILPDP